MEFLFYPHVAFTPKQEKKIAGYVETAPKNQWGLGSHDEGLFFGDWKEGAGKGRKGKTEHVHGADQLRPWGLDSCC